MYFFDKILENKDIIVRDEYWNSFVAEFMESAIAHSYTGSVFTHDFTLTTGTYYWRVRNIDEAGNEAAISEVRQLTVN